MLTYIYILEFNYRDHKICCQYHMTQVWLKYKCITNIKNNIYYKVYQYSMIHHCPTLTTFKVDIVYISVKSPQLVDVRVLNW